MANSIGLIVKIGLSILSEWMIVVQIVTMLSPEWMACSIAFKK